MNPMLSGRSMAGGGDRERGQAKPKTTCSFSEQLHKYHVGVIMTLPWGRVSAWQSGSWSPDKHNSQYRAWGDVSK